MSKHPYHHYLHLHLYRTHHVITPTILMITSVPDIQIKRLSSLAHFHEVSESVRGDVMETAHIASKGKSAAASAQLLDRGHRTALADSHQVRDLALSFLLQMCWQQQQLFACPSSPPPYIPTSLTTTTQPTFGA
jgi:hypothetical protein